MTLNKTFNRQRIQHPPSTRAFVIVWYSACLVYAMLPPVGLVGGVPLSILSRLLLGAPRASALSVRVEPKGGGAL
eukprot:9477000-Pyramimonas_sp.AAC.1